MQNIALMHHAASRYGVLGQMVQDLQSALRRSHISSVLLHIEDGEASELVAGSQKDIPDCTWAINTIIGENLFYYPFGIPHVSLFVDSVTYVHEAAFTQPHLVSLFVDKASCDVFSKLSENPVYWFPHAISQEAIDSARSSSIIPLRDRPFDVTLIGSFLNHESELDFWKRLFSSSDIAAFISFAEKALAEPSFAFLEGILAYVGRSASVGKVLDHTGLSAFALANSIERYARGLDRERLLQSLQGRDVHIFTLKEDAAQWAACSAAQRCTFHPFVPFSEVINICRMSRIVIQSAPHIRQGYHERLFLSLASGAVTLVNAGPQFPSWLRETGRIVSYSSSSLAGLASCLDEAERRPFESAKILSWLENEHSWDARLRQHLPQIEESVARIHAVWGANPFWNSLR